MNKFYPKISKYRKMHKNVRIFKNKEYRSNFLRFGNFGIAVKNKGTLTSKQLITIDNIIRKRLKPLKTSKYWITVFPFVILTKKPLKTRMGKGAGAFSDWVYPIKENKIFLEFDNVPQDIILDLYKKINYKISLKIKIVKKYDFSWK